MNVSRRTTHLFKYFIALAFSLLLAQATFAQASENQQIAIEGTLTDSSGNPIDLTGAQLVFYVLTNSNCYLYGETTTIAGDSQGNILHRIGSSTLVAGSPNGFTQNLFFGAVSGTTTFAGNNCVAAAADVRLVEVYYPAQNIRAALKLGTVPYAHNTTMLNGKNASDFLGVTNDSNTLFYGGSTNQVLTRAASGGLIWSAPTLTAAQVTTALGYTPASTTTSLTASSITTALGYTPANSASAGSVTNITAGQGLSGGSITSSGTISINFGTSAGTVVQGNDSRILGALQAMNNLSDIASATIARANLGIGNLATKSTINLSTDVSGVLPIANGGTQWSQGFGGIYTVSNTTIGSTTTFANTALYVAAPISASSTVAASINNTNANGYGLKINTENASSVFYGLKVSSFSSTNFVVLNNGNVGFGLSNPTARLEIAAAAPGVAPLRFNSGSLLTTPASGTMEYDGLLYITDNANMRRTIATGSSNTSIDNIATINSPGNLMLTAGVVTVNGALGIGTMTPSYALDVNGTLRVTGQAYTNTGNGGFSILSDIRYKDVHGSFDRGLAEILNIDIIKFNYKKDNPLGSDSNHEYVGVSAQNLQQAIPEAVETRKQNEHEFLTVNTSPVLWTLINAVKELYHQMTTADNELKREIASLKDANEKLKTENDEFKKRLEKIEKSLGSK